MASTETNTGKERWAQLDFIVGFEVVPSKNHPQPDICDGLKGKYPKTFDFSGWHRRCRCYAEPTMMTDDEMMRNNAAILAGAEQSADSERAVRGVPPGFFEGVGKISPEMTNRQSRLSLLRKAYASGDLMRLRRRLPKFRRWRRNSS